MIVPFPTEEKLLVVFSPSVKRVQEGFFPHLAVEIAADGLLGPGLVVKRRPPLLLRVPHHVCHQLQPTGRHNH